MNIKTKTDPRVRRTRRLLQDALVSLILEKDYASISIKEIAERADVAYITFFRHYSGTDELLMEVLDEGLAELLRHIETVGKAGDVFIGITATKRSRSLVAAFRSARNQGLHSIAVTGQNAGDLPQAADLAIIVPSGEREHILQSQIAIMHLLCEIVEERLASDTHFANVAQFEPAAQNGRRKVRPSGRRRNLVGANSDGESASNGGNKTYAGTSGKSGNRNRERAGTR